jgi:CheY-like chemotaxis protein
MNLENGFFDFAPPCNQNINAAESLAHLVEMLGREVRITSDGEAGISAARHFQPDVVLMDIGMPRLNRYEAATLIRHHACGQAKVAG